MYKFNFYLNLIIVRDFFLILNHRKDYPFFIDQRIMILDFRSKITIQMLYQISVENNSFAIIIH